MASKAGSIVQVLFRNTVSAPSAPGRRRSAHSVVVKLERLTQKIERLTQKIKQNKVEKNPYLSQVLGVYSSYQERVHRYGEATEGFARDQEVKCILNFVQEVVVPITEKETLVEKAIKEEKPRMMRSLVEKAAENVTSNAEVKVQTNSETEETASAHRIGPVRNVVKEVKRQMPENTNPWHRGPLATYYDLSASCRTMMQEHNPASRQFYEKHGKKRNYKNEDMMFFCPELYNQNKKNNFKKLYSYGKDKETEKHIDQFPNRRNNVWWYCPDMYKLIYEKEIDGHSAGRRRRAIAALAALQQRSHPMVLRRRTIQFRQEYRRLFTEWSRKTYKCLDWDGKTYVLPNLY